MNQEPNQNRRTFLLEIGSEEIPARFIAGSLTELAARMQALLVENRLVHAELRTLATPRRLAVLVTDLVDRQPDREVTVKGPPVSVAFDAKGNPTAAGLGFARKAGVELADCTRGSDQRGEFLQAVRKETGLPAAAVLGETLPALILGLPFRKVMRWGDFELEYPRPLQWLVALLGDEVVPIELDTVGAGRTSRGHRTLSGDRPVEIPTADRYEALLAEAGVVVDHDRRRTLIRDGLEAELAAYDPDAILLEDEELLEEVVFLCEHPTPFLGQYSEDFFSLPAEVITTALKAHQRYFSVGSRTRDGLKPRFAAVRDGGTDHLANVVAGNERVLRARLADALFYWEFDQRKTPDQRTEMLGTVTWLEGFGTVLDKTRRLGKLADWLWRNGLGDGNDPPADLARAGAICKSDLVSEMIKDGKEFTKLEGFIGARYAELAGENETVCRALARHTLPRGAAGELPGDRISSVLSVADRLDTLAGCWLAGFVPTGAKDPYALRRHSLAVLRILLDLSAQVDLAAGLGEALALVEPLAPERDADQARQELADFVRRRMAGYFVESLEADPDVVRAVLPVRWSDPVDALAWIRAVDAYREREDFQMLATGFKRCRNILEGEVLALAHLPACLARWEAGGVGAAGEDFGSLPEPAEKELLASAAAVARLLRALEAARDYDGILARLSELGPAIDRFFDGVRVNVQDGDLRTQRHAFLREIHGLFGRYADFTAVAPADA